MGLLSNLNPFKREWQEPTQKEREAFSQGYRTGFPLEGEPHVEQTYAGTKQYKRGLKWGRRDYTPGIAWEDPEATYDGED